MKNLIFGLIVGLNYSYADFIVLGYAPSWSVNPSEIRYEMYTHIDYAFVLPSDGNGNLGNVPSASKLRDIVERGHAAGVKICLSIGGWNGGDDSNFESLAQNSSSRTRFVEQAMNLVSEYNLDGIDMDWEYPNPGNSGDNYLLLMSELGEALHAQNKILTAAVISTGSTGGGVQDEVFEIVDFLNIMSYDGGGHATMEQYTGAWDYWTGRGLAPEKTVMGIPFYCRGGNGGGDYADLVADDPDNAFRDEVNGCVYSGLPTTKLKTGLTIEEGGAGVMFWELVNDTHNEDLSLLVGINQVKDSLAAPTALVSANKSTDILLSKNNQTFKFELPVSGHYVLKIINLQGDVVIINKGNKEFGIVTVTYLKKIKFSGLSFLMLEYGNGNSVLKKVILK